MNVVLESSCRGQQISTNSLPRGQHLSLHNPPARLPVTPLARRAASLGRRAHAGARGGEPPHPCRKCDRGWGRGEAAGRGQPHLLQPQEARGAGLTGRGPALSVQGAADSLTQWLGDARVPAPSGSGLAPLCPPCGRQRDVLSHKAQAPLQLPRRSA